MLHNVSKKTVIWLDIAYMISLFEVTTKNLLQDACLVCRLQS